MSGLSKKKNNLNKLLNIGTFFYLLAVVLFIVLLAFSPNIYNRITLNNVEEVKKQIANAISENNQIKQKEEIDDIVANNTIQLVILTKERVVFSNTPTNDFSQLKTATRDDVTLYEGAYQINSNNKDYQVWLLVYNQMSSEMLMYLYIFFASFVFILCVIVAFSVRSMFQRLVYPLERLKENISKLKKYQLSEVSATTSKSEYDILSDELSGFTSDLQEKMDDVEVTYTTLERQLRANEEVSIYKTQLVSSLIHDLKTPLSIIKLSAYKVNKLKCYDKETMDNIDNKSEEVINNVNEILEIMYKKDYETGKTEQIDAIKIIKDSLKLLNDLFKERGIKSQLEIDRYVELNINKIEFKSIIHNSLVNICRYAKENTIFEINATVDNEYAYFSFKNEVVDINKIDFDNIFNLFYSSKTKGSYGSGVGLYVIKSIIDRYHGTVEFKQEGNSVILEYKIPIKGSDSYV